MPDWCDNKLTVSGEKTKLKEFVERAKGRPMVFAVGIPDPSASVSDLCFSALYPVPLGVIFEGYTLGDTSRKINDWLIANWGTKLDAASVSTSIGEKIAEYCFSTAWDRPIQLFDKVAKTFPALTFRLDFLVPHCRLAGNATWVNGERMESEPHAVTIKDYLAFGYKKKDARWMVGSA
jgi:hypothetical protein